MRGGHGSAVRIGMTLLTIVLIALTLVLVGALPTWPYSRGWGYYPSGITGIALLVLLGLLLVGRLGPT